MFSRCVIAGLALLFGASGVCAADLPVRAPYTPVMPAFDWTGFYLAVGGGFQAGTVTGPGTAGFNVTTSVGYVDVAGGYRRQLPSGLVLGLDITAPVWIAKSTFNAPTAPGAFAPISSGQANFLLLPEAQIGYAIDRWLPYFGLGVGLADIKASQTPAPGVTLTDTELSPVLIVSAGVDYALTNNWIIGVRYDHLEGAQHNYIFNPPGAVLPTVVQVGAVTDGVSGVLKYKF